MNREMTLKEIGEIFISLDETNRLSGSFNVSQGVMERPKWIGEDRCDIVDYFGTGVFDITFSICKK